LSDQMISPFAPKDGFPTLPVIEGVRFSAISAGVKYKDRPDVMLAELCDGATVAGVFTKSATRSGAVLDCQSKLAEQGSGGAAIVVNSGNANAFTGHHGMTSVAAITHAVADRLGISERRVFSASTGVIGEPLPHDRIVEHVDQLQVKLSDNAIQDAAKAIMTTDTFPKGAGAEIELDGKRVRIAGFAKGSGMIAPDMATMLAYVFTDADIAQPLLQACLKEHADTTFNAITVDSDTSTSDTLMLAATGTSGVQIDDLSSESGQVFSRAVHAVLRDLAHQVVKDGEGASKFVTVTASGAKSPEDARRVALAIANSPLVKTAIAGEDPNWGRIVMAVGKSGAEADRDLLSIRFGDILVAEKGWVSPSYSENAGAAYMTQSELEISVDLGLGSGSFTVWTCDLTHQYITINADYRS
jgi:glutamate N-acetyltransferase/amino-acid N-acetyltransferase